MFTKPDSCPVCYAPWFEHEKKCLSCGSIAELFYERSMPDRDKVDIAKIEKNVSRVRKYLVDHENHGLARYTLGLSYANLGFLPEGLVEIKRAAQLLPEKVQISYEAVALAAKQGDFSQDSLDQIDRVIERKPDFKEALYLKGIILRESGKLPAAARAMQDAYKLDENYVHAQMELKSFIQEKESLLQDPRIASSIPRKGLPQNAVDYLHVITTAIPVPPPRLGKTSMTVLAAISGNKANLMRKMYSEDLRQYETAVDRRVKQTEVLEEDFIALSELCIRATATGSRLARDDRRRAAQRPMAVASSEAGRRLSIPERSAILDAEVQRYQKQGYMLVARTETTAQLSKKHEFDCCLAFFLVLIVIGIILYLLYYLVAKKEYLIFIEVDERGRIHRTSS